MRPKGNLHKSLFPIFTFFVLLGVSPGFATATDFYVATNGADSNPGTEASPFQTIQKGVTNLSPGDILYVKAGTYTEGILSWKTRIPSGESWDNPITIAAFPGDKVIITPPSGQAFFWIIDGESKFLIIDGFIIDGQQVALHGFKFSRDTRHIRVQKCEIKNTLDSGILVTLCTSCANNTDNNTYHEFIELDVHDNGVPPYPYNAHGFYIETGHNLVEHGKFYRNAGNGGKFFHGNRSGVANHNLARHNEFFNNSRSGKWSCGLLLSSGEQNIAYNNLAHGNFAGFCILYRSSKARLFNNIAYENEHYGVYIGKNTTDMSYVENNTIYQNNGFGIFVGDEATNTVVTNNIAYLNRFENIALKNQTGTIMSHNLTSNPVFENAPGKDFRLKPESPAIDKGASIDFIKTDFTGNPRPQGSAFDIGAYEKMPEKTPAPPSAPNNLRIVNK